MDGEAEGGWLERACGSDTRAATTHASQPFFGTVGTQLARLGLQTQQCWTGADSAVLDYFSVLLCMFMLQPGRWVRGRRQQRGAAHGIMVDLCGLGTSAQSIVCVKVKGAAFVAWVVLKGCVILPWRFRARSHLPSPLLSFCRHWSRHVGSRGGVDCDRWAP
jgi:hypothetical protein